MSPDRTDRPSLGHEARHGIIGSVVETIEPHSEADPAALVLTCLAYAGASVGSGPHAVADGAQHPARIFAVLVGATSDGRKGSADANARRVYGVADPDLITHRLQSGFGSGEVLVDAVRDAAEGDPGELDKRLLVREPEFGRVLKIASRDGNTLSAVVRDAWDGGVKLQARSRARTSIATNPHIAVVGHITPDELRRNLTETEIASGFGNRFLFGLVRRSKRLPEGGSLDDRDIDELGLEVREALERARKIGRVARTDVAKELWASLYDQMADEAGDGLSGALCARAEAQTLRLSVLYAVLDGARHIDVPHLEAAYVVWSFSRKSVEYVFGTDLTGDPYADRLLTRLREVAPAGLDGTEQRDLFARNAKAKDLQAARALLESLGLSKTVYEETGGRPRMVTFALTTEHHLTTEARSNRGTTKHDGTTEDRRQTEPPPTDSEYEASCTPSHEDRVDDEGGIQLGT